MDVGNEVLRVVLELLCTGMLGLATWIKKRLDGLAKKQRTIALILLELDRTSVGHGSPCHEHRREKLREEIEKLLEGET